MARATARARSRRPADPARAARDAAFEEVRAHELFGPLLRRIHPDDIDALGVRASAIRRDGLLAVDAHGGLVYNGRARADACDWTWSLAHVITHLGLGHADPARRDGRGSYSPEWRAACCLVVNRFLGALRVPGTPPVPAGFDGDEADLAARFATEGIPALRATVGPAGTGPDLWENLHEHRRKAPAEATSGWVRAFATGLTAMGGAVSPPIPVGGAAPRELEAVAASWEVRFTAWFDERFGGLPAPWPQLPGPHRPSSGRPANGSFGVVVDTSGSMNRLLLERALDTVASSASARDVRRARVVFCGAAIDDAGWLPPEQIAGQLEIEDRRGVVLQPGVDMLLTDRGFPAGQPILLITNGRCDHVRLRRDHAWITSGCLPFTPAGPVFQLR